MPILITAINWLLPLLYVAVLISYCAAFFLRTRAHSPNFWLIPVIAVHLLFFALRALYLDSPIQVKGYEMLSILALSTATVYCVVEFASHDRRTGMFVFLLVFLFQYTSSVFFSRALAGPTAAQFSWERLHIVPAILAYTGFTISAVYGLLHLTAGRNLKRHRIGVLFDRLPPLELLGKMSWHALLFGFVFMTVAVVTGIIISRQGDIQGGAGIWDPKTGIKMLIGLVACIMYIVAILGRLVRKWSSSKVSGVTVSGFVVIMIMIIVSAILS